MHTFSRKNTNTHTQIFTKTDYTNRAVCAAWRASPRERVRGTVAAAAAPAALRPPQPNSRDEIRESKAFTLHEKRILKVGLTKIQPQAHLKQRAVERSTISRLPYGR